MSRWQGKSKWMIVLLVHVGLLSAGCVDLEFPEELALFDIATPFVVRGTAALVDNSGPCPVWIGENGVTYHLFQDPRLDNETYDWVTTPGITSRLVLSTRDDLELVCQFGTIVEVQDVLEIVE